MPWVIIENGKTAFDISSRTRLHISSDNAWLMGESSSSLRTGLNRVDAITILEAAGLAYDADTKCIIKPKPKTNPKAPVLEPVDATKPVPRDGYYIFLLDRGEGLRMSVLKAGDTPSAYVMGGLHIYGVWAVVADDAVSTPQTQAPPTCLGPDGTVFGIDDWEACMDLWIARPLWCTLGQEVKAHKDHDWVCRLGDGKHTICGYGVKARLAFAAATHNLVISHGPPTP